MTASQQALEDVSEGELNALKMRGVAPPARCARSPTTTPRLAPVIEALDGAELQLQDAAHSLSGYLNRTDLDPQRLAELDDRMSAGWAWRAVSAARPRTDPQ